MTIKQSYWCKVIFAYILPTSVNGWGRNFSKELGVTGYGTFSYSIIREA